MIYDILQGIYNIAMALIKQMKWIMPIAVTYLICKSDKDAGFMAKLFKAVFDIVKS